MGRAVTRRDTGGPTTAPRRRTLPTLGNLILLLAALSTTLAGSSLTRAADQDKLEGLRPVLTPAEATLVQSSLEAGRGGQVAVIERLKKLSSDNAGEEVSGLAQVLVAKASFDLGKYDEAAAAARHPDVDKTLLTDRALLILARAKARLADYGASASAYLRAVDAAQSEGVACSARLGAAAALHEIKQTTRRVSLLSEATQTCRDDRADILLDLAEALLAQGSRDEALPPLEEIERAYPGSQPAQTAATLIATLMGPTGVHALRSARQDFERRFARANALLNASHRALAVSELRKLKLHRAVDQDIDAVQVALARGLSAISVRDAKAVLAAVPPASPATPEARLLLAKLAPESERPARLNEVADAYPGTPVAEDALYSLATFFQKDALYAEAAPYYRRIVQEFADGSYAEGAAMRAAFEALREGRSKDAAEPLETMARRAKSPAGFLYWAGMARVKNAETERGLTLLNETAERFRNTWYGNLAAAEIGRLGSPGSPTTRMAGAPGVVQAETLSGPIRARLRELLLVGFDTQALDELKAVASSSAALEARALIEASRGELRNAIVYMKRARPEFIYAQIKDLPSYVWTTIYPLKHEEALKAAALRENLDPALVASLVCQESTFDEKAKSIAGARGLMQIMPYTGRPLARSMGVRYTTGMLNEPLTALSFGTRYFRQMMDRFDSRPEAALAAYNAGPHRVEKWLAPNPQMRSDEFAEAIPFAETRNYVMIILGAREQYRKLYGLEPAVQAAAAKSGF